MITDEQLMSDNFTMARKSYIMRFQTHSKRGYLSVQAHTRKRLNRWCKKSRNLISPNEVDHLHI